MSLQKILENRMKLEEKNQLPHNKKFSEQVKQEQRLCLLLIAGLTAILYAFGVSYFHSTEPKAARSGEILAKSEMTKREIKQLNIAKAPVEKANGK